jgi:hypothetical protein
MNSCPNVIVNCNLGGHVRITDKCCFMNELLFHFRRRKVIVIMNSISEASPHKLNGSTVLKYQLSVYDRSQTKAVVARLIKVGPQFSGSTASKK